MNLGEQPKQITILLNCPKIIVWKNDFAYKQIFILTLTWWYFEENIEFYRKISIDGARALKCIGSD